MAIEAFLRRFVVVRSHDQSRVGSELFCLHGEKNRFLCGVRAGASDYLAATFGGLDGDANHFGVFLVGEGGRLPGGTYGDNSLHASLNLGFDEAPKGLAIEGSVAKGCNKGGVCAGE